MTFKRILSLLLIASAATPLYPALAQQKSANKPLNELQQDFVDLGLGMFIHYGMPTFMDQDWSDPDAALNLFQSPKLDADQWAKAAKSAIS